MRDDAPETSLAVDGAFFTVLAHYLGPGRSAVPVGSRGHGMESVRLRRVIDCIEAHLGSQLLMLDLADVAAYSVSHLARTFRDTFGMTAYQYVTARRIGRAKEALTRTLLPIAVIALDCGFGSAAAFATAFRRNVGLTPTDYRARAA